MTCKEASGLVAAQGAVVLGTGGQTFDRFVRDRNLCFGNRYVQPAWVPTRDNRQCFVGYRCRDDMIPGRS
jgi:hypothetical protein